MKKLHLTCNQLEGQWEIRTNEERVVFSGELDPMVQKIKSLEELASSKRKFAGVLQYKDILINFTRLEYDNTLNIVFVWLDNKIIANFEKDKYILKYDFTGTISTFFSMVEVER